MIKSLQFFPKVRDVRIDGPSSDYSVWPEISEELFSRNDAIRALQKIPKQIELRRSERHASACHFDGKGDRIHPKISDRKLGPDSQLEVARPQPGTDLRQQLFRIKGLVHGIIGALFEAPHPQGPRPSSSTLVINAHEHENRNGASRRMGPQATTDIIQRLIENDEIRMRTCDHLERLAWRGSLEDLEVLVENGAQETTELVIFVDDQDSFHQKRNLPASEAVMEPEVRLQPANDKRFSAKK
jgi:hypothetical protein